MQSNINNPFNILINQNQLILQIVGDVHDNQWYLYFGNIQDEIFKYSFNILVINFINCKHCSKNFMLSLCLTLSIKNVDFIELFVNGKKKEKITYSLKSQNEFFNSLNNILESTINVNSRPILSNTICDLNEIIDISKYIEEIICQLNNMDTIFNDSQHEEEFKLKLQNILFELMDNSKKYAYDNVSFCPVAFSVELKAMDISKWESENMINQKSLAKEVFITPKIVVYYQDLGKGIIQSYKRNYNVKTSSKRPLKEIARRIYFYSSINNRKNGNTDICGLQYLGKILEDKSNYMSIFSEGECVGTYLINREDNLHSAFILSDYDLNKSLMGLIYNFYIDIDHEDVNYYKEINNIEADGYEITNLCSNKKMKINIRDFRNIIASNKSGKLSNVSINGESIIDTKINTLFVFLGHIISKQSIISCLKKSVDTNIETVIICDIINSDLKLLEFSLNNSFTNIIGNNIKKIYIVSKTLKLIEFNVLGKKFTLIHNSDFRIFDKKYNYISSIKYYESFVLTELQKNNPFGKYMITNGKIIWNKNIELKGYINFDILTSSPSIFNFLKDNLIRTISLLNFPKLIPLDNMVARLADEVNSEYNLVDSEKVLYLGSVYVSGTTYNSNSKNNEETLHFFNRNKDEKMMSVFISPEKTLSKGVSLETYKRIGKSYKIINVKNLNKKIEGRCYLDKKSTYQLFDSNSFNPYILNHTSFYGNHYLLNINLMGIYNNKTTRLYEFISKFINSSLNHYSEYNQITINSSFFKEFEKCCGIVYISHHFIDKIIEDQIMQNSELSKYIIGLNHINLFRYDQSLEFSNIYSNYIIDLIKNFKKNNPNDEIKFVIFDTLINSGRTRKEIKLYLQSLGVQRIVFVSIVDSQEQRYDKSINNYSFMNIPFPKIGSNSSCPICESIETQKIFLQNIISPKLHNHLKDICSNIRCKDLIVSRSLIDNFEINNIKSKDIILEDSQYYVQHDIEINKVITLYSFISEQIRQLNDFWIFDSFLENNFKDLNNEAAALILVLFILDFYKQSYVKLREKVTILLLEKLSNVKNDYIESICYLILSRYREDTINAVEKIEYKKFGRSNTLNLLFLYLFYYPKYDKNNYIRNNDMKLSILLENSIVGGNSKVDSYKQLHCQLINVNGEIHNSPLKNLIDFNFSKSQIDYYIKSGVSALELLRNSLNTDTIRFDALYSNSEYSPENYKKLINEIEEILCIDNYIINDEFKNKVKRIFDEALKIHSFLFLPLGIFNQTKPETTIINKLINIVNDYNKSHKNCMVKFVSDYEYPKSKYDSNELYYLFNNMLIDEIKYCLDNVRKYCSDGISPNEQFVGSSKNYNKKKYRGIMGIDIKEERIMVDIVNSIDKPIRDVNLKLRYEKEELKNIGITIEKVNSECSKYSECFSGESFVTRITIPNINFIS